MSTLDVLEQHFRRQNLAYERVGDEGLRATVDLEVESGAVMTFPLQGRIFEDLFGVTFCRLVLAPFVDRGSMPLAEDLVAQLAAINHMTPWLRFAVDPDGDIELSGDLPAEMLNDALFDKLLQTLVDYAGVSFEAFAQRVMSSTQESHPTVMDQLAQSFVESFADAMVTDFSLESLEALEHGVDNDYRAFLRAEDLLEVNANAYGAYIGEVLVQQGGGRWELAEPPDASVVMVGERRYQPLRMARAFLESDQALRPSALVRRALSR